MPSSRSLRRVKEYIEDSGDDMASRPQAEIRFLTFAGLAAHRIFKETEGDTKTKFAAATKALLRLIEARAKGVVEFENSTADVLTKVERINRKVLGAVKKFRGSRKNKRLGEKFVVIRVRPKAAAAM